MARVRARGRRIRKAGAGAPGRYGAVFLPDPDGQEHGS
jgi:hypothetical protein